jgi:DNA-directed RNA polymerase specialized sigma24 family protein
MDEIIARWAAGDAAAAEELYSIYYHRVKEFIVKRGANFVDAEDIAQEALIAGLEGLKAGRKPERLTMWLFGIARHLSYRRSLPADEDAMRQVVDSEAPQRQVDGDPPGDARAARAGAREDDPATARSWTCTIDRGSRGRRSR